jgi:hypothetical protein
MSVSLSRGKQSWGAVCAIFAVEDNEGFAFAWNFKEEGFQGVPGVYIDCASDVTSFIFVRESTIDN